MTSRRMPRTSCDASPRPTCALVTQAICAAIRDSFRKLDPRVQIRNPVMFVVFVGSMFTTIIGIGAALGKIPRRGRPGFILAIAAWLWLTVLFANFAEAVAEGRGKAQAATLRSMRRHVQAQASSISNKRDEWKSVEASALRRGDLVLVEAATSFRRTARSSKASPRSTKAP